MGEDSETDPTVSDRSRPRRRVDSVEAAVALFGPQLGRATREMLAVAHLDAELRLIGIRLRYSPLCTAVVLPLRTIIADALALDARALVLAHNHPSGDPRPSAADLDATRSLVKLARSIGLRVHDHLVFAGGHHVSLRAEGWV